MNHKIVFALLIISTLAFAHEGAHGPEQKMAPHGGVIRDSSSLMFELVKTDKEIKIYPLSFEGKPIDTSKIVIDMKTSTLTDAKKQPVEFDLRTDGNAYVLSFKNRTSYRYALHLVANYLNKKNTAKWQIELESE